MRREKRTKRQKKEKSNDACLIFDCGKHFFKRIVEAFFDSHINMRIERVWGTKGWAIDSAPPLFSSGVTMHESPLLPSSDEKTGGEGEGERMANIKEVLIGTAA